MAEAARVLTLGPEAEIAMLRLQLASAEERARVHERIAEGERLRADRAEQALGHVQAHLRRLEERCR